VTVGDSSDFPSWDVIRSKTTAELRGGVYAEDLPFDDQAFDHVACLGALLYFQDVDKALDEVKRVLKPGGRLYMRTVNRTNLYWLAHRKPIDPASTNHYTEHELTQLLERAGFSVERSFSYGFYPPALGMWWWRLVNGILPIGFQEVLSLLTPRSWRVNVVAFATKG